MSQGKVWAYTNKIKLWLEIEGKKFDVSSVVTNWAVNEIPTCECMLAIGRKADSPMTAAAIHGAASDYKHIVAAKVFADIQGEYQPDGTKWPSGTSVIFDGYLTGLGYRKSNGKVQIVAALSHWLLDLGFSSTLSATSHPANPGTFTFAASTPGLSGEQAQDSGATEMVNLPEHIHFDVTSEKVRTDLWEAIKTLLCGIAGEDLFQAQEGNEASCLGEGSGANDRAKKALSRIEGPGGDCNKDYKFAQPAGFVAEEIPDAIAEAIALYIGNTQATGVAASTFWDLLVGVYLPQFSMAIVPMVDRALVVPLQLGFRKEWRELPPDAISSLDHSAALNRPLRAVAIHSGYANVTGAAVTQASDPAPQTLGGCFRPTDLPGSEAGMVMIIDRPPWLAMAPDAHDYTDFSTGVGERKASGTGTTPQTRAEAPDKPSDIIGHTGGAYGRYAHSFYVNHALQGRTAAVSGPLRFDIAPGSTLKLSGSSERFLGAEDDLAETLFGTVARVSVAINAESLDAQTSFQIVSVRSEEENKLEAMSIDSHPLFDYAFKGAPLLESHEDL